MTALTAMSMSAPANVTISWMMTRNDGNKDADKGDDSEALCHSG